MLEALPLLCILLQFQVDSLSHIPSSCNHTLQLLSLRRLPDNLALVVEGLHPTFISWLAIQPQIAHTKYSISTFFIFWPGD